MSTLMQTCPGCSCTLEAYSGPTHRHMHASPACWHLYGNLLAAEYSDSALMPIHCWSVDTYAIQHPGDDSRPAVQSVGLHLARLMIQLESPQPPSKANDIMLRLGPHKASLRRLKRPSQFSLTIADIAPFAGTTEHVEKVTAWAQSTWADWQPHHAYIRAWVKDCLA